MSTTRKPRVSKIALPGILQRDLKPRDATAPSIVKKRVPFSMSPVQSTQLRHQMFEVDRYNTRQKSQWISEALVKLLANPNYMPVVIGVIMSQRDPTEEHVVMMDATLKKQLDDAYLELRRVMQGKAVAQMDTAMDDVVVMRIPDPMGAILRAAVMNRINPVADSIQQSIEMAKAEIAALAKTS